MEMEQYALSTWTVVYEKSYQPISSDDDVWSLTVRARKHPKRAFWFCMFNGKGQKSKDSRYTMTLEIDLNAGAAERIIDSVAEAIRGLLKARNVKSTREEYLMEFDGLVLQDISEDIDYKYPVK